MNMQTPNGRAETRNLEPLGQGSIVLPKPSFETWDFLNGTRVRRAKKPGYFLQLIAHRFERATLRLRLARN
jgi:hypothetical protein